MKTYRSENLASGDVTTWLYDEATGLVTNKVYADGKGPTYDYTPDGRLSRRTWARGITTDYAYDGQGRLVSRTVSGGETARLFWLDYVVVLEEAVADSSTNRTVNVWGVDASETLGGAAGVGGLLSVSNGSGTFYPMFDGSGNVSEYLDRSGDIAAHYEYSPFGETLVREGGRADEFALRFSTKAVVPGTPLYYYGSRFYSPITGRWLNRDPIEEKGGVNLYSFCNNASVLFFDIFGQEVLADFTIKKKSIKWGGIVKNTVFGKSTSGNDLYGHWWIEFGAESYGWWPFDKVSFSSTIAGVRGKLNGVTNFKGTATTDPHHGHPAERSYHPSRKWGLFSTPRLGYGSSKGKRCKCATVDEIKDCIRSFAASYSGGWSYPGGPNCHTFVKEAMAACCLE